MNESWENIDMRDMQTDQSEALQEEQETQEDPSAPEEEAEDKPAEEAAEAVAEETKEDFYLKHFSGDKIVSREEVISLAQMGMDYGRIRDKYNEVNQKYAELEDAVSFLKDLAKEQDISLSELVDKSQAAAIAQKENIPVESAMTRVRLLRKEKELAARESRISGAEKEDSEAKNREEARKADIQKFLNDYPGVNPKDIPKEVWKAVNEGHSLTEAYARHEASQLRAQLEAERKNRENREKTTGSRSTEASSPKVDPIDRYWYEED